ncbi:hypothetical protein BZG36_01939 [Bifiguratus adelaidae]|uniref:Uncharacterized protein n=1 Tax=Bifiguratus adelaidae TaxID=1938954 RepID=A0A261Y3X8_9FUNG|nr:hypothetical protein BZG36_01939 [Bifiguratus adelaidae]
MAFWQRKSRRQEEGYGDLDNVNRTLGMRRPRTFKFPLPKSGARSRFSEVTEPTSTATSNTVSKVQPRNLETPPTTKPNMPAEANTTWTADAGEGAPAHPQLTHIHPGQRSKFIDDFKRESATYQQQTTDDIYQSELQSEAPLQYQEQDASLKNSSMAPAQDYGSNGHSLIFDPTKSVMPADIIDLGIGAGLSTQQSTDKPSVSRQNSQRANGGNDLEHTQIHRPFHQQTQDMNTGCSRAADKSGYDTFAARQPPPPAYPPPRPPQQHTSAQNDSSTATSQGAVLPSTQTPDQEYDKLILGSYSNHKSEPVPLQGRSYTQQERPQRNATIAPIQSNENLRVAPKKGSPSGSFVSAKPSVRAELSEIEELLQTVRDMDKESKSWREKEWRFRQEDRKILEALSKNQEQVLEIIIQQVTGWGLMQPYFRDGYPSDFEYPLPMGSGRFGALPRPRDHHLYSDHYIPLMRDSQGPEMIEDWDEEYSPRIRHRHRYSDHYLDRTRRSNGSYRDPIPNERYDEDPNRYEANVEEELRSRLSKIYPKPFREGEMPLSGGEGRDSGMYTGGKSTRNSSVRTGQSTLGPPEQQPTFYQSTMDGVRRSYPPQFRGGPIESGSMPPRSGPYRNSDILYPQQLENRVYSASRDNNLYSRQPR